MEFIIILLIFLSVCVGAALILYDYLVKRKRRHEWAAYGQLVVHCPPLGELTPYVSPIVVKLLTFLRLAGIPYKLDHEEPQGSAGLTPWVTLEDGTEVADSGVIVARLRQRGGAADPNAKLTATQAAVARAFTLMVEQHLCWCLTECRIKADKGMKLFNNSTRPPSWYVFLGLPLYVHLRIRTLNHQGTGRYPCAEVQRATRENLHALSAYLGDKAYLMGSVMTEVDCTVFAQMANIYLNYRRSPYYSMLADEFPNLVSYVNRIKARLWPDWDDHDESD